MALNESAVAGSTRLQLSAVVDHLNEMSVETRERERLAFAEANESTELTSIEPGQIPDSQGATREERNSRAAERRTHFRVVEGGNEDQETCPLCQNTSIRRAFSPSDIHGNRTEMRYCDTCGHSESADFNDNQPQTYPPEPEEEGGIQDGTHIP